MYLKLNITFAKENLYMIKMDYIFIKNCNTDKKTNKVNSSITDEKSLLDIITDNFNVIGDDNITCNNTSSIDRIFEYEIGIKKYQINYSIRNHFKYCSTYLALKLNGYTNQETIKVFEEIEEKLINCTKETYIAINSYDQISEYYCNKVYPMLNNFERLLRLLMFNIYLFEFGESYTDQMNKPITTKVKERLGEQKKMYNDSRNKEIVLTASYFYQLELKEIQDVLFTPKWTLQDEIKINSIISETEDFAKFEDNRIREMLEDLKPKSDWNRFFSDVVKIDDIKYNIEKIRNYRNIVAHCKEFRNNHFLELYTTLNSTNDAIEKAIDFSMYKDFNVINSKYLSERLLEIINNIMKNLPNSFELIKNIQNKVSTTYNPIINANNENTYKTNASIQDEISNTFQPIIRMINTKFRSDIDK
jgi:hypothetical protein